MSDTLHDRVVNRLLENLRSETMLDLDDDVLRVPAWHFSSAERADAEVALLRSLPLVVGHHADLPEPGSFFTTEVLGTSLLLVRRSDGTVAAYRNMCPHRGGQVEAEAFGAKRVFSCRYHGWTFDRDDGSLRNLPFADTFGTVERHCQGLYAVHLEERHGLLWADFSVDLLSGGGPAVGKVVDEFLEPMAAEQLAGFALDTSVQFMDEVFTLEVNWKLVMDGACDVMHIRFLHPNGVGKLLATARSMFLKYGTHGHGQNFTPRKRLVAAADEGVPMEQMWKYVGCNLRLYPNAMCIAAPDHIEFWTVWPVIGDPSRCQVRIRFYVQPDILTPEMGERIRMSWAILRQAGFDEDFPMEMTIQQNALAHPEAEFVYGRSERSIWHLHETLDRDLRAMGSG